MAGPGCQARASAAIEVSSARSREWPQCLAQGSAQRVLRSTPRIGCDRTRTDDLLGAIRECDCARAAAVPALESGTLPARSRPVEAQIAEDYRGLRSIWAPQPSWCPFIWGPARAKRERPAFTAARHKGSGAGGRAGTLIRPREARMRSALSLSLRAETSRRAGNSRHYCSCTEAALCPGPDTLRLPPGARAAAAPWGRALSAGVGEGSDDRLADPATCVA